MATDRAPLDRWRFDAITAGPEKLWGLTNIAGAIGVSVDTARDLSKLDGVPIFKPCGTNRYFALRSELNAWLRTKAEQ